MRLYRPGLQGRERQQEQRHLVTDGALPAAVQNLWTAGRPGPRSVKKG
jgi:hypothetical protein